MTESRATFISAGIFIVVMGLPGCGSSPAPPPNSNSGAAPGASNSESVSNVPAQMSSQTQQQGQVQTQAGGTSTKSSVSSSSSGTQPAAQQNADPSSSGSGGGPGAGGASPTGSVNVTNFAKVDDHVYRGGRPDDQAMAQLVSLGVKTIVSLEETYNDEPQIAASHGLKLVSVPMLNLPMIKPEPEDVIKARDALADHNNQPVYVHCYHGADRTGLVVGSYRIHYDHFTPDQAVQEMASFQSSEGEGGGGLTDFTAWQKLLLQPAYQ